MQTTLNTNTKKATLFVALVTVVPLLHSSFPDAKGGWAIAGFAPALWCFWLGGIVDECRKVKWRAKAAVSIGVIAMGIVVCSISHGNLRLSFGYYMIHGIYQLAWVWKCLAWFVAGWCICPVIGKVSNEDEERRVFTEDLLTFLSFALLYAWLSWSAHYISFSYWTYNAEALSRLRPTGYYLSYIPLFGAVCYGVRIAKSDIVLRLMNIRWLRLTVCVFVVLAGLICLVCCFGGYSYINTHLLLANPLLAGLVYVIIQGVKYIKWNRISQKTNLDNIRHNK